MTEEELTGFALVLREADRIRAQMASDEGELPFVPDMVAAA